MFGRTQQIERTWRWREVVRGPQERRCSHVSGRVWTIQSPRDWPRSSHVVPSRTIRSPCNVQRIRKQKAPDSPTPSSYAWGSTLRYSGSPAGQARAAECGNIAREGSGNPKLEFPGCPYFLSLSHFLPKPCTLSTDIFSV